MAMIGNNAFDETAPAPQLVSFTTGTDSQIAAMINAYYDGTFSLQDIQSVWSVGDTRDISLSAMEATGVVESHVAQTRRIQILDFDHDTLTTAVGNITKALVTIDFLTVLYNTSEDTSEEGYMNSIEANVWPDSARFYWLNNVFYNALPSYLKNNIKNVNKLTSAGNKNSSIVTTSQKCFLLSEIEVINNVVNSFSGEGSQYHLFATDINKVQKSKYLNTMNSVGYWLRSPYNSVNRYARMVGGVTTSTKTIATNNSNIAPAFCL